MTKRPRKTLKTVVFDLDQAMESIAPTALAQEWDNVGLIVGDPAAMIHRVLLCIDLTHAVIDEAIRKRIELVLAYHPPIFRPIGTLRADSTGTDALVFRCVEEGIAIYATHTALDAAEGGTNDVIAALLGIQQTGPLEWVDQAGPGQHKLVVFVPPEEVENVADAMFAAGAGQIGDYSRCSYRVCGTGTFLGGESTSPAVGRKGRLEYVEEVRLEAIVPGQVLPGVIQSMIEAHSYEEPAFDIYPLKPKPARGIGRVGALPGAITLSSLARKLKRSTGATCVQTVGPVDRKVSRAVIVVGAAGSLPFRIPLMPRDVIITGEIRHHDALTIQRHDCTAIALGHWASERPVLEPLAKRLQESLPGIALTVSRADADPFHPA